MADTQKETSADPSFAEKGSKDDNIIVHEEEVNASGHKDQLQRQYGLLSICATALTIGMSFLTFALWASSLITRPQTTPG